MGCCFSTRSGFRGDKTQIPAHGVSALETVTCRSDLPFLHISVRGSEMLRVVEPRPVRDGAAIQP